MRAQSNDAHRRRIDRWRSRARGGDAAAAAELVYALAVDRDRLGAAAALDEARKFTPLALQHPDPNTADFAMGAFVWRDGRGGWESPQAAGPDPAFGIAQFRTLAKRGVAAAMYSLHLVHLRGIGGARELSLALRWARRAASHGETEPLLNLGVMWFHGEGVERNLARAVRCYREAAEHGDALATANLGLCHRWGEGVKKDLREFWKLTRRAAKLGSQRARLRIAIALLDGVDGMRLDRKQGGAMLEELAASGSVEAQIHLAVRRITGDGVPKREAAGLAALRRLARRGEGDALLELAHRNHDREEFREAIRQLERAVELEHAGAMHMLSRCLRDGHAPTVRRNARRATTLLRRAAELGDAEAMTELGRSLLDGATGFRRDRRRGVEWLECAVRHHGFEAAAELAARYRDGRGVAGSSKLARRWAATAKRYEVAIPAPGACD